MFDHYHACCVTHNPPIGVQAIRHNIYIGETQQAAEAIANQIAAKGSLGIPPEATIIGDVESVAQAFNELAALGFTDVIMRNLVPDQAEVLTMIRRLAQVQTLIEIVIETPKFKGD